MHIITKTNFQNNPSKTVEMCISQRTKHSKLSFIKTNQETCIAERKEKDTLYTSKEKKKKT